jgi:hypothetical protein
VLSVIYEQDFLPCSFGGRPKLSAHHALATLNQVIAGGMISWVLEAPVTRFEVTWLTAQLNALTAKVSQIADRRSAEPEPAIDLIALKVAAGIAGTSSEAVRLWAKKDSSLGHKRGGRWVIDAARLSKKLGGG